MTPPATVSTSFPLCFHVHGGLKLKTGVLEYSFTINILKMFILCLSIKLFPVEALHFLQLSFWYPGVPFPY